MRLLIATLTIGGLCGAIVWAFLRGARRQEDYLLHFPADGAFLTDQLRNVGWPIRRDGYDWTGPIE